ncbi:MAG TPA: molybdopterin-binding protein [Candidatus Merdenecus merdavium]|nr:molybdopterin-binding protein [Candidatus Merdenecus merdavium]
MKVIKTEEAVGHVLCHDITQIIKGSVKDAVFRKGHVVREEDIPVLLSVGKENLYVWEKEEGFLHENEGAEILREICQGDHMRPSEVKEGKIDLYAECDGLFKVDSKKLLEINSLGDMMIATRSGNFAVKKGDKLAGTRVIPLVIKEERMELAKEIGKGEPILQILKFKPKKVGIVTTGSEVAKGRIKDTFTPVIIEKVEEYGATVVAHKVVGDDTDVITQTIKDLVKEGADFIICTGGMSVDPDDKTPLAIKNTGANIVTYGAPVLPGAMFLLGYYQNNIPVTGLPGCVMYAKKTIFDLILPRIMADEKLTAEDFHELGEGGLCLSCPVCTFPNCGFGK